MKVSKLSSKRIIKAFLIVVVLLLVVFLGLRLLGLNFAGNSPTQNLDPQDRQTLPLDQVFLEDNTKFTLGDKTYSVPAGWVVTAILRSDTNSGYNCSTETCSLILLGTSEESLPAMEVVISSPGKVSKSGEPQYEINEDAKVTFDNNEFTLKVQKDGTFRIDADAEPVGEPSDTYNISASGCNDTLNACIYVDFWEHNPQKEGVEIEELRKLLGGLKLV